MSCIPHLVVFAFLHFYPGPTGWLIVKLPDSSSGGVGNKESRGVRVGREQEGEITDVVTKVVSFALAFGMPRNL